MGEVEKTLGNLRSLRAFADEVGFDSFAVMCEKMNKVRDEKKEEIEKAKRETIEREKIIRQFVHQIKEKGLNVDAVITALQKKSANNNKNNRSNNPPKYRYVDVNGEIKTWSGRGRMPYAIRSKIAAGKSLEDFSIGS